MEFYRDPIDMAANYILYPELLLAAATCEIPTDYVKKEFVFRVVSATGASYLFQVRCRVLSTGDSVNITTG